MYICKMPGLMRKILGRYIPFLAVLALSACIRNDIPYPVVELSVTSVTGEGFACAASDIDASSRTAVIHLDETTDISNVVISEVGVTEGARADVTFPGIFDMRSDLHLVLELYQQYEWTIKAEQSIERSFRVEGQIGASEIDAVKHEARAYVPEGTDMSSINILEMKLGPEGITTYSPAKEEITSFETYRTVDVKYHSFTETWTLYLETTDVLASMGSAVAGTRVMWLEGSGVPDTGLGFRYRKSGEETWTEVADADLTVSGGTISAYVGGLEPETVYEVVAYSDDYVSDAVTVTTGADVQLHNMSFDNWYQSGGSWYPDLDTSYQIWDSANSGSSVVGINPTTPEETDVAVAGDGKKAARLQTHVVFGMIAAGNVYTGKFLGLAGLSGARLNWGVEFTARPTALKGYYKYQPELISDSDDDHSGLVGKLDTCQIQILLTDWDTPFKVNTSAGKFVNFDADYVLAYGKFEPEVSGDMQSYEEFTIPLEYRDLTREPKYIVITACASKYGDYFTGGEGSVLLVDELELEYDKLPDDGL